MFIFNASLVHREIDVFSDGCQLEGEITQFFGSEFDDIQITGDTLTELLAKIRKYFNVSRESLLIDSCEELGRLDIQTYTKTTKGLKCSYSRYEKDFKSGKIDLYLNNITGEVTKTGEPLNLTDILESENKSK